jgi:predicted HicB family RNase H-like nuclease
MAKASIRKPTVSKPGADKTLKFAEKGKSKSGQIPDGDVRLTANIKEELHTRLKIEAAKRRMSIGDLVEELIETHIPKI